MTGHVLGGVALTLVNVETGMSFAVQSAADGSFSAVLPAGSYVFSSPGKAGIAISRAPLAIEVFSGKVASANVEIAALSAAQGAEKVIGNAITDYDQVDCITENTFTEIFVTLDQVVSARLNFKSNLSDEYFYTEFEEVKPFVPPGPTHRAFIPKVLEGGGITELSYYISAVGKDFAESKTPDKTAKIVEGATACEGKLAAIGNPTGNVTVLSASGSAAGALAGFGGVAAGTAITTGVIAAALAAAAAGTAVIATRDSPTPTPTVVVPTTPTPTGPTPTPTPALCSLSVVIVPDAPAPVGVDGRYCTVDVVTQSRGTFRVNAPSGVINGIPCSDTVVAFANVAPESSITTNRLAADWSNSCTGSALGRPCVFNPLSVVANTQRDLGLTCQTR